MNETPIEVGESQETLNIFNTCQRGPIQHSVYLFRIHLDPGGGNDEAQVSDLGDVKLTFGDVGLEAGFSKLAKYPLHVDLVFLHKITVDQDII